MRLQVTSFRHNVWQRQLRRRQNRSWRRRFLHDWDRRIDRQWWKPSFYGRHEVTLPSTKQSTINNYNMRRELVIKSRIYYDYYYFYGLFSHKGSTNHCALSSPDVMVILSIHCTGGDNHRTYSFDTIIEYILRLNAMFVLIGRSLTQRCDSSLQFINGNNKLLKKLPLILRSVQLG